MPQRNKLSTHVTAIWN